MRSEAEVRETFGDLNRRIVEWRRIPVGPPIHVPAGEHRRDGRALARGAGRDGDSGPGAGS